MSLKYRYSRREGTEFGKEVPGTKQEVFLRIFSGRTHL